MAQSLSLLFSLVSIVVVAPDAPDAELRVVESCEKALGDGACVPSTASGDGGYHAEVALAGDTLRVVLRGAVGQELVRELSFSPDDREEQRWIAAGLLVAAMIAALPEQSTTEPHQSESSGVDRVGDGTSTPARRRKTGTPPPHPSASTPQPSRSESVPPAGVPEASTEPVPGFALGFGLLARTARPKREQEFGAQLRGTRFLADRFGLTLACGAAHSLDGEPSRTALFLSAGPTLRLQRPTPMTGLWLDVAATGEWLRVAPGGGAAPTVRWVPRWGGRVELRFEIGTPAESLWVSLGGSLLTPRVTVRLDGQETWESSPWMLGLSVGGGFYGFSPGPAK